MKLKVNPLKTDLVIAAVRDGVRDKELKPGDRLPSVNELSRTLSVSPSVVYRGLLSLVNEGILECQGTRGFFVPLAEGKDGETAARPRAEETADRVYFSVGHHSDLTWHWSFETYDDIRAGQLDVMAERLEKYPDMCAYVEQARIMERYFGMRPEKKEVFLKACREGRFSLLGGFLIPDLNMASGELLVRNLQLGRKLYFEMFGVEPVTACEADAFGMCAQLPQILIKSGYRYLSPGRRPGLTLPRNQAFRWKGPDGTEIPVTVWNYNVVPNCFACNWPIIYSATETLAITLDQAVRSELSGPLLVHAETEVDPIPEELFALIDRSNRKQEGRRVEFGSIDDYAAAMVPEELPVFSGEMNPVFTGCYTTRCGIKKQFRQAENLWFAAEMLSLQAGKKTDLSAALRLLMECSFHDAVCGCHTDEVNRQLNSKYGKLRSILGKGICRCLAEFQGTGVFNPGPAGKQVFKVETDQDLSFDGIPVQRDGNTLYAVTDLAGRGITPLKKSRKKCALPEKGAAKFTTDFFAVDFSGPAPEIRCLKTGRAAALPDQPFGEILVRSDVGTMWTERFKSPCYGKKYSREEVVSIETGPVMTKVVTEGSIAGKGWTGMGGFRKLSFQKVYRFFRETDFFLLNITLDFEGFNTKVLVRFPVPEMDVSYGQGTFATPFGSQVRSPYFEVEKQFENTLKTLEKSDYVHASGDYPALHWVDYSDLRGGLSIANAGTAGFQCVNGWVSASLLRSATMVDDGCMTPETGALDNGRHTFDFAFRPHDEGCIEGAIRLGEMLNHEPLFFDNPGKSMERSSLFELDRGNISLSGIRPAEGGAILRLFETLGKKTRTVLCSKAKKLYTSDLQEKDWQLLPSNKLDFAPFEIKTIKMEY